MPGEGTGPPEARAGTAAAPQATFAALAVPNFRRYVLGQALSLIGTWVETVAQALLVLRLTHSGTLLGLTTAARYAPILLLSPYAGLLVDRYPKRPAGAERVWPMPCFIGPGWSAHRGRRLAHMPVKSMPAAF